MDFPLKKALLATLKKAKVSPQMLHRVDPLLEAIFYPPKVAQAIHDAVLYLCGVAPKPPTLPADFDHLVYTFMRGMQAPMHWDDLDRRWLDLVAQPRLWKQRSGDVFSKARDWLEQRPEDPVVEPLLAALSARGCIHGDPLALVFDRWGNLLTAKAHGRPCITSAGRYVLERFEAAPKQILAAAWKADRPVSLANLLLRKSPKLFDRYARALAPKRVDSFSYFAELLLEADAKKHEKQVVVLTKQVRSPYQRFLAVRNLARCYGPAKYQSLILDHLLAATRSLNQKDVYKEIGGVSPMSVAVVKWAIETYGKAALPVVRAFDQKPPSIRQKIYPYVRKLGKDAIPILIEGLMYPGPPRQAADAKYALGILKLLSPEELEHRTG